MNMHEHILADYDVKLVGPEAEVLRYRRDLAELGAAADALIQEYETIAEPCSYWPRIEALRDALRRKSNPSPA